MRKLGGSGLMKFLQLKVDATKVDRGWVVVSRREKPRAFWMIEQEVVTVLVG